MPITRDAFLYLDPKSPMGSFGQCSTCMMWTGPRSQTCTIHGPNLTIQSGDSCGLYVHGDPMPDEAGHEMTSVTPKESGLVSRQVRCENCASYVPASSRCRLFIKLNEVDPKLFRLDPNVHPAGCCNAQQPKN